MDTLHSLIRSLTKEELRAFKLYSQRYASGADGLSSRLLDMMRKEDVADEETIFGKIYGANGDKNTYYRLKNRLQEDVCDTLVMLHFGRSETNHLHRAICTYNILMQKSKPELAYHFIRKAEKKARETENYELLDLIYANIVKLSNEVMGINPEEYISKQTANAKMLDRLRQMDQVLATLNYRIKVTQNFQKGNDSLLKLVDKTVRDFSKDKSISDNRAFQIKIYRIISQAMVQQNKFKELESFLLRTYSVFKSKNWFDRETHDVQLQMLVYITNTFITQNKFTDAVSYSNQLGVEILKYDRLHYEKYMFFYYNNLLIINIDTDYQKALTVLSDFESAAGKGSNSYYDQFINLNRSLLYFKMGKIEDAIRALTKLYINDNYKKADRSFKLKVEIAEAIMQYEANDNQTANKRIKQIRKAYKDMIGEEMFADDKAILDILQNLTLADGKKIDAKTLRKINSLIKEMKEKEEITTHVIDYQKWLEALKKRKDI
jgi:hypothetical protein